MVFKISGYGSFCADRNACIFTIGFACKTYTGSRIKRIQNPGTKCLQNRHKRMIDFKLYFDLHHSLCSFYQVNTINQNSGYSERLERYSEPIYPSVVFPPEYHRPVPSPLKNAIGYFHQTTSEFPSVPSLFHQISIRFVNSSDIKE